MTQSADQLVREYRKASRKLRRQLRDPEKAKAFLIRAGVAEKSTTSPSGVRLAKRFR